MRKPLVTEIFAYIGNDHATELNVTSIEEAFGKKNHFILKTPLHKMLTKLQFLGTLVAI